MPERAVADEPGEEFPYLAPMRRLRLPLSLALAASQALLHAPVSAQSIAPEDQAPGPTAPQESPSEKAPPAGEGNQAPPAPAEGDIEEGEIEESELEETQDPPGSAPEGKAAPGEETLSDEELEAELGEEGVDVNKPPAKGKGAIAGLIKDTEYGEPLAEAPVQVLGTKIEVLSDVDGRFRLELPPGTYSIRISYDLHKPQRIDGIVVTSGGIVRMDAQLTPDQGAVEAFDIVEEADKSSLEGIILARQRATIVGDSIGRAEISKSPDRNAAQAAQRVVGATVVGGRFVYVRGLGERYTNALLNGVPLPSPEPDRAAVPLDLFPASLLSSLTIAKTFTPEVPADFVGGSVRVETREIPSEPLFQISARGAYNTNNTFRERLTHRGGDLDWLGIDDGSRALPDGFPDYSLRGSSKPNGDPITTEERTAAGLKLNNYMSAERSGTPPDHGISVLGGNGWDLGDNRKFGIVGSFGYSRGYTVRRNEILRLFQAARREDDPRGFATQRDYRATSGTETVNWNAFGSATYRFSPHHRISLIGLRSTLADNRTQYITGYHDVRDQDIHATRLSLVTRALNLSILNGEHLFQKLGAAELSWNLTLSSALRDEPDRRDTVWGRGRQSETRDYRFTQAAESGRHFFSEQTETQYGAGFDWTQPLSAPAAKLKFGGLASLRTRNFTSRTLSLESNRARGAPDAEPCAPGEFDACNDALFVPENIGTLLVVTENTLPQDAYDAKLNIYSGYVMADLALGDQVRVIVGERVEHTLQTIDPYDQFGREEALERARISEIDLLPAVSAVWSPVKKTKLRVSLTRTLARPQLRELAPFRFQDYFGGRVTAGNPDLEMTRVTNLDTRIEHFPTLKDVLAFSLFYKDFAQPIEPVILAGGDEGSFSYRNAESAKLIGVELEARQNLEFFHASLRDFSAVANLTLAHSRIQLPSGGTIALTNSSRPLVNQAPWVLNLALDFAREATGTSARLLYNIVGPRVAQVGSSGLDDVYEHPRSVLDLTVQQKLAGRVSLKLEGRNLLNSQVLLTQGCGSDGLFGSTWHLSCSSGKPEAVNQYTEGVTLALSGSYEF